MKILLLANGSKPRAMREMTRLSAFIGHGADCISTEKTGDAARIAEEHAHSHDIILTIGGDGSIHDTVCGLMRSREKTDQPTAAILPWPMGSGNDFARHHGWTSSLHTLEQRLQRRPLASDVGQVTDASGARNYFINAMSLGLGPQVAKRVNAMPTHLSGKLKFGYAILRTFPFYRKHEIAIRTENWEWQGPSMAVVVANARYFGSGIGIAPDARTDDGLLDITVIGNVSTRDYLRNLSILKRAEKVNHPEVHYRQSKQVEVMSSGLIETDGETQSTAPVRIEVVHHAIHVY